MNALVPWFEAALADVLGWLASPQFYLQVGTILTATLVAAATAALLTARVPALKTEPLPGPFFGFRSALFRSRDLFFPILNVLLLGVAVEVASTTVEQSWLIRIAQSLAVVLLLYTLITRFVTSSLITTMLKWVGIPLATLHVFGWLDEIVTYLDGVSLQVGNIRLSAYAIARTVFFGVLLFWLGGLSSSTGKRVIRSQPKLDASTREVIAKLFEIGLFVLIFLLLLQVMGINLTALAVFGGALGVGLGFGLQQIAANFVSGLIILLDRSITIDDYIELEDGRKGRLRELNLRSATLETFDGKDIVVPNERFITTAFTNWTHYNQKQRYNLKFSVAYDTDLPPMLDMLRELVASHPQVLSGPSVLPEEQPDAEIESFGESGINIQVEYWMMGIDDGANRVDADLLLMIWAALRQHGIEMPFPQREIKIIGADAKDPVRRAAPPAAVPVA